MEVDGDRRVVFLTGSDLGGVKISDTEDLQAESQLAKRAPCTGTGTGHFVPELPSC